MPEAMSRFDEGRRRVVGVDHGSAGVHQLQLDVEVRADRRALLALTVTVPEQFPRAK